MSRDPFNPVEASNETGVPSVRRSPVPSRPSYSEYRNDLRLDFWFSCAYCTLTEVEAQGIGFHIDHYEPQSTNNPNINEYANLMYSCQICNGKKGNYWPSPEKLSTGVRIVRPDIDCLEDHYDLNGVIIDGYTTAGSFTIKKLHLNSGLLKSYRASREKLHQSKKLAMQGLQALARAPLDKISPQSRAMVRDLQRKLKRQFDDLQEAVEELVREHNRSQALDMHYEFAEYASERQKFLAAQKAVIPKRAPADNSSPPNEQ